MKRKSTSKIKKDLIALHLDKWYYASGMNNVEGFMRK